jgi:hypothetical protein
MSDIVKKIVILDRSGQPLTKFQQNVKKSTESWKKFEGAFSKSPRSLNQLNAVLERAKKLYAESTNPTRMKAYAGMIEETKTRIQELEESTSSCAQKSENLFGKYKNYLGAAAAISVVKKAFDIGKDASEAASQVEQYNTTLKTMLGSSSAARDRMQEYFNIAKQTPFELGEVVEGGNKLQAIGRYSKDSLIMLGDLAAASGKPLEQVMNAYSKLATGQKGEGVNMFRDLLISVEDWTKATGKGVSKNGELKASTEQMVKALPKIMQAKGYFGMMQAQADTTKGKLANLQDGIFQLQAALGERLNPSVNTFAVAAGKAVDTMKKWVEIPLERKIAQEKNELNYLVTKLIESNDKEEDRKKWIDELNKKYPEFLKNIDTEKVKTGELAKKLEDVNLQYDTRMKKSMLEAQVNLYKKNREEEFQDAQNYELYKYAKEQIQVTKQGLDNMAKKYKIYGEKHLTWFDDGRPALGSAGGLTSLPVDISEEDKSAVVILMQEKRAHEESLPFFSFNYDKKMATAKANYEKWNRMVESMQKKIDGLFPTDNGNDGEDDGKGKGKDGDDLDTTLEDSNNSIATGGQRNTTINIRIGDMVREMNFNGSLNDNKQNVGDNLKEVLAEILGMAELTA